MNKLFATLVLLMIVLGQGACASTPKNPIPRRGETVAEGAGQQLSFRAPEAGLVSVYDANADAIVHSSAVSRGSVIALNPVAGNITVTDPDHAGTQVVHSGIEKSHRYEMWFIPVQGGTYTATSPSR